MYVTFLTNQLLLPNVLPSLFMFEIFFCLLLGLPSFWVRFFLKFKISFLFLLMEVCKTRIFSKQMCFLCLWRWCYGFGPLFCECGDIHCFLPWRASYTLEWISTGHSETTCECAVGLHLLTFNSGLLQTYSSRILIFIIPLLWWFVYQNIAGPKQWIWKSSLPSYV